MLYLIGDNQYIEVRPHYIRGILTGLVWTGNEIRDGKLSTELNKMRLYLDNNDPIKSIDNRIRPLNKIARNKLNRQRGVITHALSIIEYMNSYSSNGVMPYTVIDQVIFNSDNDYAYDYYYAANQVVFTMQQILVNKGLPVDKSIYTNYGSCYEDYYMQVSKYDLANMNIGMLLALAYNFASYSMLLSEEE